MKVTSAPLKAKHKNAPPFNCIAWIVAALLTIQPSLAGLLFFHPFPATCFACRATFIRAGGAPKHWRRNYAAVRKRLEHGLRPPAGFARHSAHPKRLGIFEVGNVWWRR
jgi:hypothetical protein